ncbi:CDP-diacylglycerol---serine O-phosphatidyltransferase, partial [Phenoliferia sp. Uapishka_3]
MTTYFRSSPHAPANSSSGGPRYGSTPLRNNPPLRQGSAPAATLNGDRRSPSQPANSSSHSNSIKCSDCGSWVELFDMGEHICATAGMAGVGSSGVKGSGLVVGEDLDGASRRRRPEMRLDIEPAGSRLEAYGNRSARSPLPSPGLLGPSSPASRPTSPSYGPDGDMSRSPSTSSVSSNGSKLPFFERYQKLVATTSGPIPGGTAPLSISRSGGAANLLSLGNDSPLTPSPIFTGYNSRSPSPSNLNFPVNNNTPSPANSTRSFPIRGGSTDLPYASSTDSRSSDSRTRPNLETPASSVRSGSPPRSRKISMPEAAPNPSNNGSRGGGGMKVSQSTPSKLSSYARPSDLVQKGRKISGPGELDRSGGGGLEACLEDLRLMTSEDDDGGAGVILASFRTSSPERHSFEEDEGEGMTTPRANRRPKLPYSQSTPALNAQLPPEVTSSRRGPPIAMASLPSSASSGSLKDKSSGPRPASQCTTCRKVCAQHEIQRAGDGQTFCRPCYADRFLPKCRKCRLPIEGGAVASSDGKVLGKTTTLGSTSSVRITCTPIETSPAFLHLSSSSRPFIMPGTSPDLTTPPVPGASPQASVKATTSTGPPSGAAKALASRRESTSTPASAKEEKAADAKALKEFVQDDRHFSLVRNFRLADIVTLGNGFCGAMSLFSSARYLLSGEQSYLWYALGYPLAGMFFDALDGKVARWRNESSMLGQELDSLADSISFGVAPAMAAFCIGMRTTADTVLLTTFICAGIARLARFNATVALVPKDEGGKSKYFEGLPIPSSLFLCGVMAECVRRGNIEGGLLSKGLPGGLVEPIKEMFGIDVHKASFVFLGWATLMISKTLRVPKF